MRPGSHFVGFTQTIERLLPLQRCAHGIRVGLIVVVVLQHVGSDVAGTDRDASNPLWRMIKCHASGQLQNGGLEAQ
jgi:hypothetical protein